MGCRVPALMMFMRANYGYNAEGLSVAAISYL
jgi:hypothetical protein